MAVLAYINTCGQDPNEDDPQMLSDYKTIFALTTMSETSSAFNSGDIEVCMLRL